jgi:uncharacterized membrane protein YraQ (UPF0718 family)
MAAVPAEVSTADVGADRRREMVAFAGFVAVAALLLTWAKWWPYSVKIPKAASTHALGTSIITGDGSGPPGFSLTSGLDFARTYFTSIWPALVAGLVIGAAVTVLVPRTWPTRAFATGGRAGTVRGGLLAIPTMMCSCCAAPVVVGLRRRGASIGAGMGFWVGNPALNPAVLAFSFFVLGWRWAVLRAAAGALLLVGIVAFSASRSARLSPSAMPMATAAADSAASPTQELAVGGPDGQAGSSQTRGPAAAFLATLGGLALRLLPEYLLLVVLFGALRGPLFTGGIGLGAGVRAVVIFAVAGALLPIPTAGEVPAIAALLALGVSAPVAAALLITLPALSVPSLVMVRRVFPLRVLGAITAAVVALGLATAATAALVGL